MALPPADQLSFRIRDLRRLIHQGSYTSRDLPIPGTPTTVTSCGVRSARAPRQCITQHVQFWFPASLASGGTSMPSRSTAIS